MKKTLLASLILVGSLGAASAQANEAVVGAVVGGGVGSVIGHSVGGNNGALLGGIVGALAGVALASDNSPRYVSTSYGRPGHYQAHHAPAYRHAHPVHVRPVKVIHKHHQPVHRHDNRRHWH